MPFSVVFLCMTFVNVVFCLSYVQRVGSSHGCHPGYRVAATNSRRRPANSSVGKVFPLGKSPGNSLESPWKIYHHVSVARAELIGKLGNQSLRRETKGRLYATRDLS